MAGPQSTPVKTLALEERLALVLEAGDRPKQLDLMLELFSMDEMRVVETDLLQRLRSAGERKRLKDLLSLVRVALLRQIAAKSLARKGRDSQDRLREELERRPQLERG